MTGRKNRARSDNEALHEYRLHEQIERGEKLVGSDAEWLDRRGPAASAGRRRDALTRHAGGRHGSGSPRGGAHLSRARPSG